MDSDSNLAKWLHGGSTDVGPPPLWTGVEYSPDTHVAFRGSFATAEECEVEFKIIGASWFQVWLDGEPLTEGPARFPKSHPEFECIRVTLPAGKHVVAAHVHHEGVTTRLLEDMRPFFGCEAFNSGEMFYIDWKALPLEGYKSQFRRVSSEFGWMEWCDTRKNPSGWQEVAFDDDAWPDAVQVEHGLGTMSPLSIGHVKRISHKVAPVAEGVLTENFGYEEADPPLRFFLRDLAPVGVPAQGVWHRYDLKRVRLGRPSFVLDVPEGAVVEIAQQEILRHERVAPFASLTGMPSSNMDHFVARGGVQTFEPLTPKGGRYVEVHVLADPASVKFVEEAYLERAYHGLPEGSFSCDDPLLSRIWKLGIDTYQACAEDAITDCPTRERGQWIGDLVNATMDVAAAGYTDLRLCKRALIQAALCTREDGLVAGLCPGGNGYLATYSAAWVSGCVRYWELTGDREFLVALYPYAVRNLEAFVPAITKAGFKNDLGWGFVDWGYVPNEGECDISASIIVHEAYIGMVRWNQAIAEFDMTVGSLPRWQWLGVPIARWFEAQTPHDDAWERIGYHRTVLGLLSNFFNADQKKLAVEHIKHHILNCFPNNPNAPRLSDPSVESTQLITPYFASFAFPALIQNGELDFVLDQIKTCWGWMLDQGLTTCAEVFDLRWSHSHAWSACPTWILSRYVLGLKPRADIQLNCVALDLVPGSLQRASGEVPIPALGVTAKVEWERDGDGIRWRVSCPEPLIVSSMSPDGPKETVVSMHHELRLALYDSRWYTHEPN